MAPSLCLPQQGCQLILCHCSSRSPLWCHPLPRAVAQPLLPACLTHVLPPGSAAQGHSFTPGMALEELQSTARSACRNSRPNHAGIHHQPYCWGFWQGAILPFTQICFSSWEKPSGTGQVSLCWGYDVLHQHQCRHWLCRLTPEGILCGSLSALKLPETCLKLDVTLGTAGRGEVENKPMGRERLWPQLKHHCGCWGCAGTWAHSLVLLCQRETSAVGSTLALVLTKGTAGGTKLQGVSLKRPPCCDKAPKSLENEGKGSGRGLAGRIKGSAALEMDLNHTLKQPTTALQ